MPPAAWSTSGSTSARSASGSSPRPRPADILLARLLPGALFRLAAPLAHTLRHRWRVLRRRPLSGVTMIACDLDGRVLMVRHSYGPGGWHFPGGGIARGEDPQAAALRELAEETGCTVEHVRYVGALEETISGSPHTAHVFAGTTRDVPRRDGREVVEARFYPLHSLPAPMGRLAQARLDLWRSQA